MVGKRRRLTFKQPEPLTETSSFYFACRQWRESLSTDITHKRSLLGVFSSPQAAFNCASHEELKYSWKSGTDVKISIHKGAEESRTSVVGKVLGRIETNTKDIVNYLIIVQSMEDLNAVRNNSLCYNHWGRRGPKIILPGSSLNCNTDERLSVEVPHKFIDVNADFVIGDKCYTNNGCETLLEDNPGRMHFAVKSIGMPQEAPHVFVVFWGHDRCAPDDFKVFPVASLANSCAHALFHHEVNELKSDLKVRCAASGLEKVDTPVHGGIRFPFRGVPHRHCFSFGHHEGLFAGGISDFRKDDLGDLTLREELDFAESSDKFFFWVEKVTINEARPLSGIARRASFIQPGIIDASKNDSLVEYIRPTYASVMENGSTFDPALRILGFFSDACDARRVTAQAERKDAYRSHTRVCVEVCRSSSGFDNDMSLGHSVNGTIIKRIEDSALLHGFAYSVNVDWDDKAKELGMQGSQLRSTWRSAAGSSGKEITYTLNAGVEGDPATLVAPRSLIRKREFSIFNDPDIYEVRILEPNGARPDPFPASTRLAMLVHTNRGGLLKLSANIQNLIYEYLASDLWAVFYEPSLTGWGDKCKCELFWTASQANRRASDMFMDRMNRLRLVDSPDHMMAFRRRTKTPSQFRCLTPNAMLQEGYPKIRKFKKAVGDRWQQCFTKTKKHGLVVAAIFNDHGDEMGGNDGTMSEWFWVEQVRINAERQSGSSSKSRQQKRGNGGRSQ